MAEEESKFGKPGGYHILGLVTGISAYICVSYFEHIGDYSRIWAVLAREVGVGLLIYVPLLYLMALPVYVGWKIALHASKTEGDEDSRNLASYAVIAIIGFAVISQVFLDGDAVSSITFQGSLTQPSVATSCANAINSRIDGEFRGWDGDTVFALTNGQVWQQSRYEYFYNYRYQPAVNIVKDGAFCKMFVEGTDKAIQVRRLR